MKRLVVTLATSLCAFAAHAQIPTTDGAHIGTSVSNFVESFQKQTQQLAQLKSQYDAMVKQYNAITGMRNMGDVLNNPALRNYMPDGWQASYDNIGRGVNGLSSDARKIYDKYKVFDSCGGSNGVAKTTCYSRAMKGATDKATWTKAFDTAKGRIGQIESLMAKVNTTKDAKAIAELQARIQAETALLQNQQIMVQLQKQIADAEAEINSQREREAMAKRLESREGLDLHIMTF